MGTTLSDLRPPRGAKHRRKRLGRGYGSGHGTTAARGQKGQRSRSGGAMGPWFEGGQMPLQRRLPKRGFRNIFREEVAPVNVGQLALAFDVGTEIDAALLKAKGLIPRRATRFKVLGNGKLAHALVVKAQGASKSAREKIEAAGGRVEIVAPVRRSKKTPGDAGAAD